MSIHMDTIVDGLFRDLRKLADEADLRDALIDVWIDDLGINDIWGSVGDREGRLASRKDIRDNLYPEKAPIMMKLLVKNAKAGLP